MTVTVLFTRKRSLGSLLLRTALWSAWSHCAILDGDEVIEAAAFDGVRVRKAQDMLRESSEFEAIAMPASNPAAVIAAARAQVGRPYDWLGVLGIGFRRRWQDVDAWFCSELIAHAFAEGGSPLFRAQPWRITPRDLYIARFG